MQRRWRSGWTRPCIFRDGENATYAQFISTQVKDEPVDDRLRG